MRSLAYLLVAGGLIAGAGALRASADDFGVSFHYRGGDCYDRAYYCDDDYVVVRDYGPRYYYRDCGPRYVVRDCYPRRTYYYSRSYCEPRPRHYGGRVRVYYRD